MKTLCVFAFLILQSFARADDTKLLPIWLKELDSEVFQTRSLAHEKVKNWAVAHKSTARTRLKIELKLSKSPEVQARLQDILHETAEEARGLGSLEADFDTSPTGILITDTTVGGVSQLAGINKGDVIVKIDKIFIQNLANNPEERLFQFKKIMLERLADEELQLIVRSGVKLRNVKLKLGKLDTHRKKRNWEIERKQFKLEQQLKNNHLLIPDLNKINW